MSDLSTFKSELKDIVTPSFEGRDKALILDWIDHLAMYECWFIMKIVEAFAKQEAVSEGIIKDQKVSMGDECAILGD